MKKTIGIIIILALLFLPLNSLYGEPAKKPEAESSERLSLDIKGMDILDVFRILSMRAGFNIVAGKNVTGRVTLFLKDVDIWDAFEIIISANALAYVKKGNIIYVMTARDYEISHGRKYQDKRIVKSVKLKHARAQDIARAISQLKTNIGRVIADDSSDTIVLVDIPEAVTEMEKVLNELDIPLETKVYALQYASAEVLKDKLTEMLTKNVGSLRIDERTNKVVITDLVDKMPEFDKLIAEFDTKHKEVLIEAKILQITLEDEHRMGINWDAVFVNFRESLHKIATVGVNLQYAGQGTIIPTPSSTSSGGALQIGELDSEGYQAVIQALDKYGQTNILSSPRIVALNNQEAKILIGTNQPYATRSISQTSGGASNIEAENVTFLDLGVKLYVTPTINADGYVTMKIKPEVSSKISDYEIMSSGNLIPVVKTTTAETTVMVKNSKTILIGGLIEERDEAELKEVPGLSRIPLIGKLFRSEERGSTDNPEKTELVIFLTPHIITGDEAQGALDFEKIAHDLAIKEVQSKGNVVERDIFQDIISDDMMPHEYYDLISLIINERVENYRPIVPIYGEILISFTIDNSGKLISEPRVAKGDNKILEEIGKKSVRRAAPFPAFPASVVKKRETFEIAISYQ
ncbi:MAG: hypothetical protein HQ558_00845 [Candidatus Omnitrophica bacterium]|nr:hypothetical protein [Candidatus Omnitrophota bacterium]